MTYGSSGGAATTAGTTFQEETAAWFSALILVERDATPPCRLPADVTLEDILAETTQTVDDLKIGTSAGGQIFVQVKTSISCSPKEDSEFAKVITQFVLQVRRGYVRPGTAPRPLDPLIDRLVLVVSPRAPSSIREDFRDVLDRVRSAKSVPLLAQIKAAMNQAQQGILELVLKHARRVWLGDTGGEPTEQELVQILQLAYVHSLDVGVDGSDLARAKDWLRQRVLRDPSIVDVAWDALLSICRGFGPRRTGGDRTYLRHELTQRGIDILAPPSYRQDIEKLRRYTASRHRHLAPLSLIKIGSLHIKIQRSAVQDLSDAAQSGHLLVVGRPGAGKSGCLHDFVKHRLDAKDDVVLIAVDQLAADSSGAIDADLGLSGGHSLVEVLENWSGSSVAYLVIDALDAARTQFNLEGLCRLISDVQERAPRWRVVATIREYDLQHSRELKRLFSGAPSLARRDPRFGQVRHVAIMPLDADELEQVRQQAPAVNQVLDHASAKLRELIQNPFNLRLACELIEDQVQPHKLSAVHTQIGLLDLYWQELAEDREPRHIRPLVLKAAVDAMVKARALSCSVAPLLHAHAAAHLALTRLLSDGVLLESDSSVGLGAERSVAFSHNILFDYAVARMWLEALPPAVISRLAQSENQDLLLAIRPSLVFTFQRLWHEREQNHSTFWQRGIEFQATPGMRFIGKIIAATVAAEEYTILEDIAWLLNRLRASQDVPQAIALIRHTINAALTQHDEAPGRHPIVGPGAGEWLQLALELSRIAAEQTAWDICKLITQLDRGVAVSDEERAVANEAARHLLSLGLAHEWARGIVPYALNIIALTAEACASESILALARCLSPEEVERWGYEYLEPMAKQLGTLARLDPDFTVRLVGTIFQASAERDDRVLKGGRILALSFSKSDMLDGVRTVVAERFRDVMRTYPELGAQLAARVMEAVLLSEHPTMTSPKKTFQVAFLGGHATLKGPWRT